MIEGKIGKECGVQIMATGSVQDLANDVLCIMNGCYQSIKQRDQQEAELFRLMVGLQACNDGFWSIRPDGTAVSIAVPKKEEPEVE